MVLTVDPALGVAAREQVEQLLDRAEAADGYLALNEAAVLALRHDASDTVHLTALAGDRALGLRPAGARPAHQHRFPWSSIRPPGGRASDSG